MIDQAEFINFQSHEYSLLEFSHKLSIIKGRSHSGKSSLVRAMKWLIENKPRGAGDKYKRDFSDKSDPISISFSFDDGKFVTREKTSKQNAYVTSEHEDPFVALRTDVPDEIVEIIKLRPHNLRSQNDKYFLIDKTSGQVATELNKVVGLQIIDEKSSKIKKVVSDLSSRLKVLSSQIDETKEKLKSDRFKKANTIKKLIDNIDREIDFYESEKEATNTIKDILEQMIESQQIIKKSDKIIKFESDIVKVKNLIIEYERKGESLDRLKDAFSAITEFNDEIRKSDSVLKFKNTINKIKDEIEGYDSVNEALAEVKSLYRNIGENEKTIATALQTIEQGDLTLSSLKKELNKKMEKCPTCGALQMYWNKNPKEGGKEND